MKGQYKIPSIIGHEGQKKTISPNTNKNLSKSFTGIPGPGSYNPTMTNTSFAIR